MRVLLSRALGQDQQALKSGQFYCGPDQGMQISSLYLQMQVVNAARPNTGGATSPDLTPHDWSEQWGGFPVRVGMNATPGRIDLFTYSTWYMGETVPLELYDFGGGITMAPVPDITNGGYLTSVMFAYNACFNLCNSLLRAGVYVTNAAPAHDLRLTWLKHQQNTSVSSRGLEGSIPFGEPQFHPDVGRERDD